jgi:hypothetical protein
MNALLFPMRATCLKHLTIIHLTSLGTSLDVFIFCGFVTGTTRLLKEL